MATPQLFSQGELTDYFRDRLRAASEIAGNVPRDQFMNARPEEIITHVLSQTIMEPLSLHEEEAEMETIETIADVSRSRSYNPFGDPGPMNAHATTVVIVFPFTGEPVLWNFRPSSSPLQRPNGRVIGVNGLSGRIGLEHTQVASNPPEYFRHWKDQELGTIRSYLQSQKNEVDRYNRDLAAHIARLVHERRARIQHNDGLKDILGIPLKRKAGVPIAPINIVRRLVRPLPPPPRSGYKPEPGIEETDYLHILSVIRHEGRTFETKPSTFAVHDEEGLRDILLAHLNGHYEGEASSETFRGKGKTDICIEDQSRAAFIAECKVWKGGKQLLEAIDQLLGYVTWRDCKTALVIFNKHNANFTGMLDTIPKTFEVHPLYRGATSIGERGEWQFQMTSAEDAGRQLRVHVFLFDLSVSQKARQS